MLVHEQLRRFEGTIVAAARNGHLSPSNTFPNGNTNIKSMSSANTAVANFGSVTDMALVGDSHWSFSEALIYSVTVITTIGESQIKSKAFFSI